MFQKSTSLFLAFLLIFSGCSHSFSTPEPEASSPIIPSVKVEMTKRTTLQPEIKISGSLSPQEEITIASEVMGTVSRVLQKEGGKITAGAQIMKLSSGDNMASVSFSSAQRSLASAQKLVALTKASGQKQVKNAELAVDRAKITLDRLEKTKNLSSSSQKTQTVSTQSSVDIAQKGFDLAQKAQTDMVINEEKTHLNLLETMANTVSSSFVSLNAGVNFVDTLFGISNIHKTDNDAYEYNIWGNAPVSLQNTLKNSFEKIAPQIEEIKAIHEGISKTVYTKNDEAILLEALEATDRLLKETRTLLRTADDILQYSFVNAQFPESQLSGMKSQINGYLQSIEGSISSFSAKKQALMDFSLQSPQRILDAEIQVSVAQSKVISAEQALLSSENTEKTTDISLDSGILEAKNALAQAIANLEMAKIQASVGEQNAISQWSAAQASFDSAALSLSKLSIASHIGGTITKVLKKEGDTVQIGTPLLVISNVSALILVSDVSVEESLQLRSGMPAQVQIETSSTPFAGIVSLIAPEADKGTRRVKIEIMLPNPGKIPANTFATATIKLPSSPPKIFIPLASLISQNPPTVMIAEPQNDGSYRLKKQILELGKTVNGTIEVAKGLRPNQMLVTEVYPTLFEGDVVQFDSSVSPPPAQPESTVSTLLPETRPQGENNEEDPMKKLWKKKEEL